MAEAGGLFPLLLLGPLLGLAVLLLLLPEMPGLGLQGLLLMLLPMLGLAWTGVVAGGQKEGRRRRLRTATRAGTPEGRVRQGSWGGCLVRVGGKGGGRGGGLMWVEG